MSESAFVPTAGSLHEAASPTESTAFFFTLVFFYSRLFFSFFIFSERDEQGVRNGGVERKSVCVYLAAS